MARRRLGQGTALWSAGRVADVLADAVLDGGWPAEAAVGALLAVAGDPATRSPARVCCPGPWWDVAAAAERARSELAAEGQPVTRTWVIRRAVQLLDRDPDDGAEVSGERRVAAVGL